MLVGAHVQHKVMLVLRLFVANRTFELRLDATLEPDVAVEAVRPGVRVAAPRARVRAADDRRRHCHRGRWRSRHAHTLEHRHRQGGRRTRTARVRRGGQLYRCRRGRRKRFRLHAGGKLPQVRGRRYHPQIARLLIDRWRFRGQ